MPKAIHICDPDPADREQIVAFLRVVYSKSQSPEYAPYMSDTGDAGSRLDYCIERKLGAIAKIGRRVVGIAGWRLCRGLPVTGDPVCAELVLLYVAQEVRRRGVARRLCTRYLLAMREAKIRNPRIALYPTPELEALFAELGFREHLRIYESA